MTEPEAKPLTKEEQNRKIVRGGCQTVLGFVGIVVLIFLFDWKAATALQRLSLAGEPRDLFVLVHFKSLANGMFWSVAFTPLILLLIVSVVGKSLRTSLSAAGVGFVLMLVVAIGQWWHPFLALEFRGDTVRLVHLWPRPATVIETSSIISATVDETTTGGNMPQVTERLVLETKHGTYRSMYGGNASGAAKRLKAPR